MSDDKNEKETLRSLVEELHKIYAERDVKYHDEYVDDNLFRGLEAYDNDVEMVRMAIVQQAEKLTGVGAFDWSTV